MLLKEWDKLPEELKNDDVREYYDILLEKKLQLLLKRLFDVFVSVMLIIILSPVMLILSLLIKYDSKGPVIFKQVRITKYNKEFHIYKFRTMIQDAESMGTSVTKKNDDRITRLGKKIRKARLDELPQLFNILKGEMTFVGTRPEVKKYVDMYSNEMYATLLMPAGVTSLASINYRDEDEILSNCSESGEKSVDEIYVEEILPNKMKYNLEHLRKFNVCEDFMLCVKTII